VVLSNSNEPAYGVDNLYKEREGFRNTIHLIGGPHQLINQEIIDLPQMDNTPAGSE
jgi:hypothetical protein